MRSYVQTTGDEKTSLELSVLTSSELKRIWDFAFSIEVII